MNLIRKVFDRKGTPILVMVFLVLFIAEGKRPLRKRSQLRFKRVIINALVSLPAFSLLRFLLLPVMIWVAGRGKHMQSGVKHRYKSNPLLKSAVVFLLLDYSNYLWHVLLHRLPLLWRFHVVHHSDRDLDLSTALRFHFGEIIASVFYRGAFVLLTGATPLTVLVYEICFESATQFHHSNTRLPLKLERALNKIIVTPRMHGIHHSVIRQETDSNYSVIFSFWDRLHKTIRLNVPQDVVVTGVPSYNDPKELTISYLLRLPFTNIRLRDTNVSTSLPDKTLLAE